MCSDTCDKFIVTTKTNNSINKNTNIQLLIINLICDLLLFSNLQTLNLHNLTLI